MFTLLCSAVCSLAVDISSLSFGNIWAFEPKKPACLMNKQDDSD